MEDIDNEKRRQFEEAIEIAYDADPDDASAYLVYADWLQSKNDPRGELIVLQHKLELRLDPAVRAKLKKREEEIFALHRHAWLGPLAEHIELPALSWHRGFLGYIQISTHLGAEAIAALSQSEAARFLRSLEFSVEDRAPYSAAWDDGEEATDPVAAIKQYGFPQSVRSLSIHVERSTNYYSTGTQEPLPCAVLSPYWQKLEDLRLEPPYDLTDIDLPRLCELSIDDQGGGGEGGGGVGFALLKTAHLPKLQSLHIGCWRDLQCLETLPANRQLFPALRELHVGSQAKVNAAIARAVIKLPVLAQLDVLNLDYIVDQDGAIEIAQHIDAFAHLASLSLKKAPFTREDEERVRTVLGDRVVFRDTT